MHTRLTAPADQLLLLCRYLQGRRDKAGANFTYEVVVVDDGSSDQTAE